MRFKNLFVARKANSRNANNTPNQVEEPEAIEAQSENPDPQAPWWIGAGLAALIVALVFITVMQYQANAAMVSRLEETSNLLRGVELRTAQLEAWLAELQENTTATSADLEATAKQLKQTRSAAWKLRQDHSQTAKQLNQTLAEQRERISAINEEVTEVRDEVSVTQDTLADTRMQLGRAMGDLGVQSGLVARNQEELEELKRRGEREYIEFDVRKSKQYTRVGDLAVRLNKTDRKRSKFTLTVLQNDRNIEKKDRTLYEPVQFYTGERGRLLELVVFTLEKDRVAGYLSLPKQELASNAPVR